MKMRFPLRRTQSMISVASSRRVETIRPARSLRDILSAGLCALMQSVGLLRAMTAMRLKMRYRYSILGWFWGLCQPIVLVALYSLIFSRFSGVDNGSIPYSLFVFAGLVPWAFCSTSISTAAAGMLTSRSLMATTYFPREIVPISYVAASLVDLIIASCVLLFMMAYFSIPIPITAIFVVPIVGVLAVMVIAICLFISSIQVRIRDVNVALPLMLQVLVFTAPIVYPASAIPSPLQAVYWLNPFAILIQSFRDLVVVGKVPIAGDLLYCTAMAVACFVACYILFKKVEPTLVDDM
jgi:lipopolysaccharide transport system permease protein